MPSYLYKLIVVLDELERNVEKVDGSKSKTYEVAMYDKLGMELKANIIRVKQKADDLFNWFPRQEKVASRKKRIVGMGVAIASGVVATTALSLAAVSLDKVLRLEDIVDEYAIKIDELQLTSVEQDRKLNELIDSVNGLNDIVETNVFSLDITNKMFYLYMSLKGIEQELDFCIEEVRNDINKIVHAASGKVTADLLDVQTLLKLLNRAHLEKGFRPLFWGDDIYNYYNVIRTKLTPDDIIIEIPA